MRVCTVRAAHDSEAHAGCKAGPRTWELVRDGSWLQAIALRLPVPQGRKRVHSQAAMTLADDRTASQRIGRVYTLWLLRYIDGCGFAW